MARPSTWTSRARALARRGWTIERIAEACGYPPHLRRALRAQRVDDPVSMPVGPREVPPSAGAAP